MQKPYPSVVFTFGFLRYIFQGIISRCQETTSISSLYPYSLFTQRSSVSLYLLVGACLELNQCGALKVYVPALYCSESLTLIKSMPCVQVVFYDNYGVLNANLSASPLGDPAFLVIVDYFGHGHKCQILKDLRSARPNLWVIRDSVHSFVPDSNLDDFDFQILSPYKHVPVPHGAYIVGNQDSRIFSLYPQLFQLLTIKQECLPSPGVVGYTMIALWLTKRALYSFGLPILRTGKIPLLEISDDSHPRRFRGPYRSSTLVEKSLESAYSYYSGFQYRRDRIASAYNVLLSMVNESKVNHEWCKVNSYLVRYGSSFYGSFHSYVNKLSSLSYPVVAWPDFSVEIVNNLSLYPMTFREYTAQPLLNIPISSRLSSLKSPALNTLRLLCKRYYVEPISEQEWYLMLQRSTPHSYLQSIEYALSRKRSNNQTLHLLSLTDRYSGNRIALCQMIRISKFGFNLFRLNMGPILLDTCPLSHDACCLLFMHQLKFWARKYGLSAIIASLPIHHESATAIVIQGIGYIRNIRKEPYTTALISLSPDETALKRNLHGKWRNMLSKALRSNVAVRNIVLSEDNISLFISRYERHQLDRGYSGIPSESILGMFANRSKSFFLNAYEAFLSDDFNLTSLGFILTLTYQRTSTYIVGCVTPAGRSLQANSALIWHAIVDSKSNGIETFDLGGISDKHTPDVAKFKRGLNGDEVTYIQDLILF